ncbi:hypothetical protein GGR52DRAFT_166273 [Hypoxylon sp. FL1284]|nr:hypothetical protein GGR52DRAFT_166273 [Hypoxylon sp. FL1284]
MLYYVLLSTFETPRLLLRRKAKEKTSIHYILEIQIMMRSSVFVAGFIATTRGTTPTHHNELGEIYLGLSLPSVTSATGKIIEGKCYPSTKAEWRYGVCCENWPLRHGWVGNCDEVHLTEIIAISQPLLDL